MPTLADWLAWDPGAVRDAAVRELERRSFERWLPAVSPSFTWTWSHLQFIRERLHRITTGQDRYLILSCPPRHGKSEQGTVRYPAWRIENRPETRVIVGAYNQKLAEKFSRKAKRIIEPRVSMSKDQQELKDWATVAGGGIRSAGVGSGVTGTGADLILIDDPVKSRKEAESQTYRDTCWGWFSEDIWSRQEPGCAVVLTMTRWHEDDLVGRILASDIGHLFTVVNLPAIAGEGDPLGRQPGEALCPERYDVAYFEVCRKIMRRNFEALYQGSPRPAEGNKFKRGWFRYWEWAGDKRDVIRLWHNAERQRSRLVKLKDCRLFATMDVAASEKQQADYTVIAYWCVTPDGDLILLDLDREKTGEPDTINRTYAGHFRWKPGYFSIESNGVGLPLIQNLRRGTVDSEGARRPGLAVRGVQQHVDKVARAATAIVRVEAGQVYFPDQEQSPWVGAFESELLGFPNGKHDDQVDALSLAAADVFDDGPAAEPEGERIAREAGELRDHLDEMARQKERGEGYYSPDQEHWWH